jgi:hypothetical protein
VFEMRAESGNESQLPEGVEIVSRVREAGGSMIRAVSPDGSLPPGATAAEQPTLEEGYLAFMAQRGRDLAEIVGEEES